MTHSSNVKKLLVVFFCAFSGMAFAQETPSLDAAVQRAVFAAQHKHRSQSPVVKLDFEWEQKTYLSDKITRRRPGFKDVLLRVEHSQTHCLGVLAQPGNRVFTPLSCAQGPEGFSLKKVRLSFSNGKRGAGNVQSIAKKGDFAEISVSSQLTQGISGAVVAPVAEGKTLQETFGEGITEALLDFFISRGVVSARANRVTGTANTLQVGEPFFYEGKLVALVNRVPTRLPVSFIGGISEDGLSVFRVPSAALLADR